MHIFIDGRHAYINTLLSCTHLYTAVMHTFVDGRHATIHVEVAAGRVERDGQKLSTYM
jgi:hypothetical protein